MKSVVIPSRNGGEGRSVTISLLWDDCDQCWIGVINDPKWRCVCARGREQEEAMKGAIRNLFEGSTSFDPKHYPFDEVWAAYCAAREMPASPIYSIPV